MNKIIMGMLLSCVAITGLTSWSYVYQKKVDQPLPQSTIEKKIIVIIPSYNNIQWYQRNLDSVRDQQYKNYRVVYIDDASKDGTAQAVINYVKINNMNHIVDVIANRENQGALANIYAAVHNAPDDAIIVTLDGDDWFAHEHVLATINNAYADPNVWMTYGNYTHYPDQKMGSVSAPIPQNIIDLNAYRRYTWCTSHLRTFYAWLFKKIEKADLCDTTGFYRVTWDQAFIFPMLEMAAGRWRYITEILYVYNVQNPLNDFKVRLGEQLSVGQQIRAKRPYQPLQKGAE